MEIHTRYLYVASQENFKNNSQTNATQERVWPAALNIVMFLYSCKDQPTADYWPTEGANFPNRSTSRRHWLTVSSHAPIRPPASEKIRPVYRGGMRVFAAQGKRLCWRCVVVSFASGVWGGAQIWEWLHLLKNDLRWMKNDLKST